jgi:cytochrome c oxidase subunit IV
MAHDANMSLEDRRKAKVKKIMQVTLILSVVTGLEFVVAFIMGAGFARTSLFFIMTVVKAYFIVSEFMHLGHEVKPMKYAIVLPFVFILWLIVALLVEGDYIFDANSWKFLMN